MANETAEAMDRLISERLATYRMRMKTRNALPIFCVGISQGEILVCLTEDIPLDTVRVILGRLLGQLVAAPQSQVAEVPRAN